MTEQLIVDRRVRAKQERERRSSTVLAAAIEEALAVGYQWINRDAVAERAGVSNATVSNAFGGMLNLKRAVMREAVVRPIPKILAEGLADGSTIAKDAPADVKAQALATLTV